MGPEERGSQQTPTLLGRHPLSPLPMADNIALLGPSGSRFCNPAPSHQQACLPLLQGWGGWEGPLCAPSALSQGTSHSHPLEHLGGL